MSEEQFYVEVQSQLEREQSMKELAAALVKAQAEMTGAKKDSANPFFKSKYADLSSVMEAIRPALTAHGLGFVQVCHDAPDAAKIETIIIHESGQTLSCGVISVPVSKGDAQAMGSAITYAKRYSLQAAFGVPSVDDDGNAASVAAPKKAEESSYITPAQLKEFRDLLASGEIPEGEACKRAGIDGLVKMRAEQYEIAKAWAKKLIAKRKEEAVAA